MFITKKHIPRRTFLQGAGVTLALPLLESMLPALTPTRMTAAAPVRRFVGIWNPNVAFSSPRERRSSAELSTPDTDRDRSCWLSAGWRGCAMCSPAGQPYRFTS